MKEKLLAVVALGLLTITTVYAEDQKTDPSKAEVAYDKKLTDAKSTRKKASEKLQRDYEKYGRFSHEVMADYRAISDTALKMGDFDDSIEYAMFTLKVAMKLLKADDPKLAKLYYDTGNKYYMHKQHPTAVLYMEKAAAVYNAGEGKGSLALADTYEALASIYVNLQDFKKSLMYNGKALEIRKAKLSNEDEAIQRSIMNDAYLHEELKKEY